MDCKIKKKENYFVWKSGNILCVHLFKKCFIAFNVLHFSSRNYCWRYWCSVFVFASRLHSHDEVFAAVLSKALVRIGNHSDALQTKRRTKLNVASRIVKVTICYLVNFVSFTNFTSGNRFNDSLIVGGSQATAGPTKSLHHLVAFIAFVEELCGCFWSCSEETRRCHWPLSPVDSRISVEVPVVWRRWSAFPTAASNCWGGPHFGWTHRAWLGFACTVFRTFWVVSSLFLLLNYFCEVNGNRRGRPWLRSVTLGDRFFFLFSWSIFHLKVFVEPKFLPTLGISGPFMTWRWVESLDSFQEFFRRWHWRRLLHQIRIEASVVVIFKTNLWHHQSSGKREEWLRFRFFGSFHMRWRVLCWQIETRWRTWEIVNRKVWWWKIEKLELIVVVLLLLLLMLMHYLWVVGKVWLLSHEHLITKHFHFVAVLGLHHVDVVEQMRILCNLLNQWGWLWL